jgi:hypothetical protein
MLGRSGNNKLEGRGCGIISGITTEVLRNCWQTLQKKSIRTSDLQEEVWSQNLPNTKNEFTMTMLSPLRRTVKRRRHIGNLKVHTSRTTETECVGVHYHFPTDARKRTSDCLIPTVNCVTIRTQLPWEGTFPLDVNKSRRHIKRANTRTIDVPVARSLTRIFSFVACTEEWQTTVITNRIHGLLRGIVGHKKGNESFQRQERNRQFPPSSPLHTALAFL